ncbi:hypothetical protein ACFQZC_22295 [Streptacidiphilus monticola]
MGIRQSWPLRALRALVFAGLTLALSAGAHLLVNAQTPLPGRAMALTGAGVFVFALAATAAERGYWQIAGALVPLELALNSIWNVGQADCFSPPPTGATSRRSSSAATAVSAVPRPTISPPPPGA